MTADSMLLRIVIALAVVASDAMPLAAQRAREQAPALAPGSAPFRTDSPAGPQEVRAGEVDARRWMAAFEQERARTEVNRPRWVFPVAGAVIGGVAGLWYHQSTRSGSDFMGPIDPVYILGGLGATAGGLTGWYVDAAQRQWIATRPTPKQE